MGASWPIGRCGERNSVKKLLLALVFWGSALCTPVFAKTFVGVLWPMFGPLPAIGLVELVAELKLMPDVEVNTYLHQSWPALVAPTARHAHRRRRLQFRCEQFGVRSQPGEIHRCHYRASALDAELNSGRDRTRRQDDRSL